MRTTQVPTIPASTFRFDVKYFCWAFVLGTFIAMKFIFFVYLLQKIQPDKFICMGFIMLLKSWRVAFGWPKSNTKWAINKCGTARSNNCLCFQYWWFTRIACISHGQRSSMVLLMTVSVACTTIGISTNQWMTVLNATVCTTPQNNTKQNNQYAIVRCIPTIRKLVTRF